MATKRGIYDETMGATMREDGVQRQRQTKELGSGSNEERSLSVLEICSCVCVTRGMCDGLAADIIAAFQQTAPSERQCRQFVEHTGPEGTGGTGGDRAC